MPKIDDLVHVPFPLPDPALVRGNVWITQNGNDFRVAPTRLGYIFQHNEEPLDPFNNQLWWDTSRASQVFKTSAFLKVWQKDVWKGIGPILDENGNGTIPGTLDVVGGVINGVSPDGYLQITNELQVNGGWIAGPAPTFALTAAGDFTALGNLSTGLLTVNGNGSITGNLGVTGTVTTSGLNASGTVTFGGDITVTGNATVDGELISNGSFTTFNVNATGGAQIAGTLAVGGPASVGGALAVTGQITGASLTTTGDVDVGGNANVTGTVASATLTTSGNATIGGTLAASGSETVADNLSVGGQLNVTGAAAIGGALNVGGAVGIAGALNVNGPVGLASLDVTGNATIGGALSANALTITGTETITGNLVVTQDILPAANNTGAIGVLGQAWGSITVETLLAQGNVNVAGLFVSGTVPVPGQGQNALAVNGSAGVSGALNVGGSISVPTGVVSALGFAGGSGGMNLAGGAVINGPLNVASGIIVGAASSFASNVDIVGTLTVGGVAVTSDERLKTDISWFDWRGLDEIKRLQPVTFRYKSDVDGERQFGLIAQDVEKLIPEAVREVNGWKAIDTVAMITVLIVAMQEICDEIEDLRRETRNRD